MNTTILNENVLLTGQIKNNKTIRINYTRTRIPGFLDILNAYCQGRILPKCDKIQASGRPLTSIPGFPQDIPTDTPWTLTLDDDHTLLLRCEAEIMLTSTPDENDATIIAKPNASGTVTKYFRRFEIPLLADGAAEIVTSMANIMTEWFFDFMKAAKKTKVETNQVMANELYPYAVVAYLIHRELGLPYPPVVVMILYCGKKMPLSLVIAMCKCPGKPEVLTALKSGKIYKTKNQRGTLFSFPDMTDHYTATPVNLFISNFERREEFESLKTKDMDCAMVKLD